MGTKRWLPVMNEAAAAWGAVTRRGRGRRRLAAAGAGTGWPLVAASHPIHELLRNEAVLEEAENLAAADLRPLVLNAQQDETLSALAGGNVPGSTKVQVDRVIDLLLCVDTAEHKQEFAAYPATVG